MEVLAKEVQWLEQILPLQFAVQHLLADLQGQLEFVHHDVARGDRHVERAVLLRIGRRDDRHQVEPVVHVRSTVPHLKAEVLVVLLVVAQQHRLRPVPLTEHVEELQQHHGGERVRIQLAGSSDQHRPGHTAQVAHRVRVDASLLRPVLDRSQCQFEALVVGHQTENVVGHSAAVQRSHALLVEVLQQVDVLQLLVRRDVLQREPGEQNLWK